MPAESAVASFKAWPDRLRAAGASQTDAVKATGLSSGQVSSYLNGVNVPTITNFDIFEDYLRKMGV